MDFCLKLAKEESVVVLPGNIINKFYHHLEVCTFYHFTLTLKLIIFLYAGVALGLKNWLRITYAVELSALEVGLGRIKDFCERHAKKQ